MKQLPVKYNDEQVGILSQDVSGKILFVYHKEWIEKWFPISASLPLKEEIFQESECRAFFCWIIAGRRYSKKNCKESRCFQ